MKETLLFTGASGFLGTNVKPILSQDYDVTTIGITNGDDLKCNFVAEVPVIDKRYDVVLHAAGKAHVVPKTEEEIQSFFDVNVKGTKHLCEGLKQAGLPKSLIFISTVAVYGAVGGVNVNENHPLNGQTPYAKSKIEAEAYLTEWCKENNVILTILRPSLLAGPNPPGNLKAMINGIRRGYYMSVGGGKARNCILMVQDIAKLVKLAENKGGAYNVFDDSRPSYRELERIISQQLGKRMPLVIPLWFARLLGKVGDMLPFFPINSYRLDKLLVTTEFTNEKAKRELGWQPTSVLENFKIR